MSSSPWFSATTSFYTNSGTYVSPVVNLTAYGQVTTNLVSPVNSRVNTVWNIITSAIYLVILSSSVKYTLDGSCAWHSARTITSGTYQYGIVHNQDSCGVQTTWPMTNVSSFVQLFPSDLFHEIIETMTDSDTV